MDKKNIIQNSKIPIRGNSFPKSIFNFETLITPETFKMVNYPRTPIAVFNPAAYIHSDKLILLPRLIFDEKFYISSIGICDPISLDNLISNEISTRLLKFPTDINDFYGDEDPRVTEDGSKLLWVAKNTEGFAYSVLADLSNQGISNPHYLYLKDSSVPSGKDAALINDSYLVCRPEDDIKSSFSAPYSTIENTIIIENEFKPVLTTQSSEIKVGFSTNFVRISQNESIIGWHAVLTRNFEYANGLAVIDDKGELLGTTDYILYPEGYLRYGNRPNTLFGCGLFKWKDQLWWAAGIGDWAIALYSITIDKIFEVMNYIR
ncbi:MAG: hypothetical protein KAX49_11845 [Halanaerobiales bacterium]|nr:hypothetical protein [Halanaerobiales bacterium]